jgi:hypothetical protein
VKVGLEGAPEVLKPEMLVDATFIAPKPADTSARPSEELAIFVPQQSIHREEAGTFAWVADQSAGRARKIAITGGRTVPGGLQEITHGLTVGNHLIVRGNDGLNDGDRIRVAGEEAPAAAVTPQAAENAQTMQRLPQGGDHVAH